MSADCPNCIRYRSALRFLLGFFSDAAHWLERFPVAKDLVLDMLNEGHGTEHDTEPPAGPMSGAECWAEDDEGSRGDITEVRIEDLGLEQP